MDWNLYWTLLIQVFAALFILAWPVYVLVRSTVAGRLAAHREHEEAIAEALKKKAEAAE